MRVARSVLYGLLACLMLFSLSWAVQRGFFGEAPDVGEDRLRQTSRVGRAVARVVAAPSDEDDLAAPADEDDVAIDPGISTRASVPRSGVPRPGRTPDLRLTGSRPGAPGP